MSGIDAAPHARLFRAAQSGSPEIWSQFTPGYGNYTEERANLFADMSLNDLVKAIREQRSY